MRISTKLLFCIILITNLVHGQVCNYEKSTVFFDLNACKSFAGLPSPTDYSEFTASIITNPLSSTLSVEGGYLYRRNPIENPHSCAMGLDSTITMCVGSLDTCAFVADSDKAIRFSIKVTPGPDGKGRLSTLSFYEAAKETFTFFNGASGVNNYPTLFGIRILKGNSEIFRQDSIPTARDFENQFFDFTNNPNFTVNITSIFHFELLPYCLVGNGGYVDAWDVENILISSNDRDNVSGGNLTFNTGELNKEICVGQGVSNLIDVITSNSVGLNSDFIITTIDSIIIDSSFSFPFTFQSTDDNDLLIWHISYDSTLFDNNVGNHLDAILGCYELSNSILLIRNSIPILTLPNDYSVCGSNTGSAYVTVMGGSSPYTFNWSNGSTNDSINNLSSGVYTVTVTDSKGCTNSESVSITVNPFPLASIEGNKTICSGNSTTLIANGGSSYIWSEGQTTMTILVNPLTSQEYSVTVTDDNGCTATASTTVTVNSNPTVAITGDTQICEGNTTTLTASGGGTYIWSNGSSTSSISVSPIMTTDYSVTVTSSEGCSSTNSVTVTVNQGSTPTITGNNEICAGTTTTLTASGGTSYQWSTSATTAAIDVSPIMTTTYMVTTTDANGCTGIASYEVIVNSLPTVTITGDTLLCAGECTELTATGGGNYSWNTSSATGCTGSYFVGGPQNQPKQKLYTYEGGSLKEISDLTIDNVNGIGYYCSGFTEGKLYGMSRPGDSPTDAIRANFVSIHPITGETIDLGELPQPPNLYGATGLTGIFNYIADVSDDGTYYFPAVSTLINPLTFEIVDYTIFIGSINLNTIGSGVTVDYQPLAVQNTCTAYVDACIAAFQAYALDPNIKEPSGGIQDWALSSDNNTLYAFFGIENGLFTIDLTNMSGSCMPGPTSNAPFTGVTGTQTDEFGGMYFEGEVLYGWQVDRGRLFTIDKETGGLTLVNGGLPIDFRGDNATCNPCPSLGGSQSQTITVCPDSTTTYTVTVTDEKGCVSSKSITVEVSSELGLMINSLDTKCGEDNGEATAIVTGGKMPYQYNWSNGQTTNQIISLSDGTYTITVTDLFGCSATKSIVINASQSLISTQSITHTSCGLNNGMVTINPANGTNPYLYEWSNGENTASISNLAFGVFTVTVTDAFGCKLIETITINSSSLPTATIAKTHTTCGFENGSAEVNTVGGKLPYTYLWSNNATSQIITDLSEGTYSVTVTDSDGCISTSAAIIEGSIGISSTTNSIGTTCGIANGSASVQGMNGLSPFTYNWSNGSLTSSISNVSGGTYFVTVTDANGCTSTNTVVVQSSTAPNGGVLTGGPYDFCRDGSKDVVNDLSISGNLGANSTWFITDVNDEIEYIFNTLDDLIAFDFELTGKDFYSIYHVSYEDALNVVVGDNIMILTGCLDISNGISVSLYGYSGPLFVSTAIFDMEKCLSIPTDTTPYDYTEFTAIINNSTDCSKLSIVGGNFYRSNPSQNGHSCTPGIDGGIAICVSSNPSCSYMPDSDSPIKIDVLIEPAVDKVTTLSSISFYEKAPDRFDWIDGPSGVNNWPTKFGIRVLKGSQVIYEASEIDTEFDWNLREFSLSGIDFEIDVPTTFRIELMPYCPIGNIGTVSAWDIDELTIVSECREKFEGGTLTGGPYNICVDGIPDFITDVVLTDAAGPNTKFIMVDSANIVVGLYPTLTDFSMSNLDSLSEGQFKLFHISYASGLTGCEIGNKFTVDFNGCYKLSNPVLFSQKFCGTRVTIYPNPSTSLVNIDIKASNPKAIVKIFNNLGQLEYIENVRDVNAGLSLDFTNFARGLYHVSIINGNNVVTKSVLIIE